MNERRMFEWAGAGIFAIACFFFFHENLAWFAVWLTLTAYGLVGAARRRIGTFQKGEGFVTYTGLSAVFEGLFFAAMGGFLALSQARALWPSLLGSRH